MANLDPNEQENIVKRWLKNILPIIWMNEDFEVERQKKAQAKATVKDSK